MKGLKIICILTLAALLILGSMGTVFAKGPPAEKPGNGPPIKGEKQGFTGNVTETATGNVTISTIQKGSVNVTLTDDTRYKIPGVMNKWGNYTEFVNALGGTLEGRRVVSLAGNGTGTWKAVKLMALPVPGMAPMHAHRVGNVTEFNKPSSTSNGNITIIDVHGVSHLFTVGNSSVTVYHPKGTEADDINPGSFVTVVVAPKTKLDEMPLAKAIVLHANIPEGWPTPAP